MRWIKRSHSTRVLEQHATHACMKRAKSKQHEMCWNSAPQLVSCIKVQNYTQRVVNRTIIVSTQYSSMLDEVIHVFYQRASERGQNHFSHWLWWHMVTLTDSGQSQFCKPFFCPTTCTAYTVKAKSALERYSADTRIFMTNRRYCWEDLTQRTAVQHGCS